MRLVDSRRGSSSEVRSVAKSRDIERPREFVRHARHGRVPMLELFNAGLFVFVQCNVRHRPIIACAKKWPIALASGGPKRQFPLTLTVAVWKDRSSSADVGAGRSAFLAVSTSLIRA